MHQGVSTDGVAEVRLRDHGLRTLEKQKLRKQKGETRGHCGNAEMCNAMQVKPAGTPVPSCSGGLTEECETPMFHM